MNSNVYFTPLVLVSLKSQRYKLSIRYTGPTTVAAGSKA
jgi:hypothetical protein